MPITNPIEQKLAEHHLKLSRVEVHSCQHARVGPIIVGEAPGEKTSPHCPLFPWPNGSSGGRLFAMSGMSAYDYLRTFHRVNLLNDPVEFTASNARVAAVRLLTQYPGHPMVLLGTRVREAFGLPKDANIFGERAQVLITIPHPSGRNLAYNTPQVRAETRRQLWLAVDLWHHPVNPHRRAVCEPCGRLVSAHPTHPGNERAHVLCAGKHNRIREAVEYV